MKSCFLGLPFYYSVISMTELQMGSAYSNDSITKPVILVLSYVIKQLGLIIDRVIEYKDLEKYFLTTVILLE